MCTGQQPNGGTWWRRVSCAAYSSSLHITEYVSRRIFRRSTSVRQALLAPDDLLTYSKI